MAVADLNPKLHGVRMQGPEVGKPRHHPVLRERRRDQHRHVPRAWLGEPARDLYDLTQPRHHRRVQHLPRIGQLDASVPAHEEFDAEGAFELTHVPAHRRLGDAEFRRSGREGDAPRGRLEHDQVLTGWDEFA